MVRSSDGPTRLAQLILAVPVFAARAVEIRPEVEEPVCPDAPSQIEQPLRRLAIREPPLLFKAEQERGASWPRPEQMTRLAGMHRGNALTGATWQRLSPSRIGTQATS